MDENVCWNSSRPLLANHFTAVSITSLQEWKTFALISHCQFTLSIFDFDCHSWSARSETSPEVFEWATIDIRFCTFALAYLCPLCNINITLHEFLDVLEHLTAGKIKLTILQDTLLAEPIHCNAKYPELSTCSLVNELFKT